MVTAAEQPTKPISIEQRYNVLGDEAEPRHDKLQDEDVDMETRPSSQGPGLAMSGVGIKTQAGRSRSSRGGRGEPSRGEGQSNGGQASSRGGRAKGRVGGAKGQVGHESVHPYRKTANESNIYHRSEGESPMIVNTMGKAAEDIDEDKVGFAARFRIHFKLR